VWPSKVPVTQLGAAAVHEVVEPGAHTQSSSASSSQSLSRPSPHTSATGTHAVQPSSVVPSQSSSRPLHTSGDGPTSPTQAP
jgi:hypothetical protein